MTPAAAEPLLVVAGEASGDLHGARLLSELHKLRPGIEAFGLGGDELAAAGLEPVAHSAEITVVGITEVLRILPRARQIFARLLEEVDRRGARTAVLVDFPDFNLRLAAELKKRGLKVVYYISPQVWAWRRRRVKVIARRVDRMLVLFPFEVDFYRRHGVEVTHVGHPLVSEVPELPQVWEERGAPEAGEPYRLALLPGSRRSEVESLLPVMLAAAHALAEELPLSVQLIRAPTIPRTLLEEAVAGTDLPVEVVGETSAERFRAVAGSHLALCASGTATLEVGLLGTPMAVLYRLKRGTYWLARLLVRLPSVSLVNLVLERPVVPELLQDQAQPRNIARVAAELLASPERLAGMRCALGQLRERLGEAGASGRAAQAVAEVMAADSTGDGDGEAVAAGEGR